MKRVSISAAMLLGFVIANAQLKKLPPFREYLSPKNEFLHVKPYISGNSEPLPKIDVLKKYLDKEKQPSNSMMGSLAAILPNGNKIYLLPQDKMPCVVPDLSQFNMPVEKSDNLLDEKINISGSNN